MTCVNSPLGGKMEILMFTKCCNGDLACIKLGQRYKISFSELSCYTSVIQEEGKTPLFPRGKLRGVCSGRESPRVHDFFQCCQELTLGECPALRHPPHSHLSPQCPHSLSACQIPTLQGLWWAPLTTKLPR